MKTPVLFIIFNRPAETAQALEALRQVRPERLYVASDAARPHVKGEAELVRQCRDLIEQVDWQCEVKKNYAKHNLNCGIRLASALHWVFRHESQAIIVEDDLLPEPSFFFFCEEMLEKYASCEQVMLVSGRNNLGEWQGEESYFFSRTVNPWGWATWARAWKKYDFLFRGWSEKSRGLFQEIFQDEDQAAFHDYNQKSMQGRFWDTWDIQWTYSVYRSRGMSIIPVKNLVRNLGFNDRATHTRFDFDMRADLETSPLSFPLRHPRQVEYASRGRQFDRWNFLLEQLTTFKNPGVLTAIHKMTSGNGHVPPALVERYKDVIPYLYPLKNRSDSRQVLLHLQAHLPENVFLKNLLNYF